MTMLAPLSGSLSPLGVGRSRGGVESSYCLGFVQASSQFVSFTRQTVPNGLTFSAWVKTTSSDATSDYAGNAALTVFGDNNPGVYLSFGVHGGKARYAHFQDGVGWVYVTGNKAINDGKWHHIAVTHSRTTGAVVVYVDGLQEATGTIVYSSTFAAVNRIGGGFALGSQDCFDGFIDDPRVFGQVLTANEISSLYNNSTAAPSSGLVAYFPMDEGTGTSTVDQVGGLTGTLTNGPTWQPQVPPRLVAGRNAEDWSVSLDGSNDVIRATGSIGTNLTAVSFGGWFRQSNLGFVRRLLGGGNGYSECVIEPYSDNTVYVYVGGASQAAWSTSRLITDTGWHHIFAVFDGTLAASQRLKLYIDGRDVTTDVQNIPTSITWTNGVDIGADHNNARYYVNGNAKDVRIYNSALPAASIRLLCKGKEPSETPVAKWRLNDGSGTTATDSIGSNHGTLTNGPTWSGDVPQWFRATIESSQSLSLDGSNDYVSTSGNSLHGASAATFAAWVNRDSSVNANAGIVASRGTELNGLTIESTTQLALWVNSNVMLGGGSSLPAPGQWVHVVGTWETSGNVSRIYLNGVLVTSGTINAATIAQDAGFNLGFDSAVSTRVWKGGIDEACIYNRDLSAAEVADQAAGYLVTAGLVSRYKLDGNPNDSVGSNHGTEQGGLAYSTSVPGTL